MGLFSNSSGDFASLKQINALQNQIDTLQRMINIQQETIKELENNLKQSIELSSQMAIAVDNHENKLKIIDKQNELFQKMIYATDGVIKEFDKRIDGNKKAIEGIFDILENIQK